MLSSSDAKDLIENTHSSFRALLRSLIRDSSVSSILIGETHDFSPTVDAIISNLDLLANSPRRIIIISENLNQSENSTLKCSLKSAIKGDVDPLKKASFLKEKSIDTYELLYASFSVGVIVLGAENKKSNPFSTYKSKEITQKIIRKMEAYQKSPDRIIVTNKEFSKLINSFCSKDTLPIFIGGGAHVVPLSSKDQLYDLGLQGRIKNSVSIYLNDAPSPSITTSFPYSAPDRELTGQYDYKVLTNKKELYKNTFDSIEDLNDKTDYLIKILDKLISSHVFFPKNVTLTLQDELEPILKAFQESALCECSFKSLHTLLEDVVKDKSKPKEKSSFFSKSHASVSHYSRQELSLAIRNDLAELLSSVAKTL
ncbi:hypothetical protein Lgra_2202 [Legionella gratiana]|uniref:Uncharacterized protein n=1 Tax=Legionella gratiana TaxID=45066 RepID=A0A378JFQ6_9GAMM|nr:hypothetical protein [Legionella gratiana]KTD08967.1 hypothetical protein Lgra_2202 [Legionella gratiana]STX45821.1 Uncharacterised protein [Legionella gratiana]